MGQRHEGHAFMPNKYVFPGGRCEAADGLLPVVNEGEPVTLQKLKLRMGAKPSHRKARGVLVAALRETFEETGLLAGRATAERRAGSHGAYLFCAGDNAAGAEPAF